jgi:hypothetical protein
MTIPFERQPLADFASMMLRALIPAIVTALIIVTALVTYFIKKKD